MLTVNIGFYVWLKSVWAGIILIPLQTISLVWCVNLLPCPIILTNTTYSSIMMWPTHVSRKSIIYNRLIHLLKSCGLLKLFFRIRSLQLVESSWQWRKVGHQMSNYNFLVVTDFWIVILQIRVYAIYGKNKWMLSIFVLMNAISICMCAFQASGYLGQS